MIINMNVNMNNALVLSVLVSAVWRIRSVTFTLAPLVSVGGRNLICHPALLNHLAGSASGLCTSHFEPTFKD